MLATPHRPEIDHRTMKLVVGVIAISLAGITSFFASSRITSISAAYYEAGWSQVIFIGFLFAIAAFLLAYNGYSRAQMIASKIAAISTLSVALFPCDCDGREPAVPYVHGASAAVTFAILAFFCYVFYRRAIVKVTPQAKSRAFIYASCGIVITIAILVLAIDNLLHGAIRAHIPRLTYYGERTALMAFGVSWLAASHCVPVITTPAERRARRQGTDAEVPIPPAAVEPLRGTA